MLQWQKAAQSVCRRRWQSPCLQQCAKQLDTSYLDQHIDISSVMRSYKLPAAAMGQAASLHGPGMHKLKGIKEQCSIHTFGVEILVSRGSDD